MKKSFRFLMSLVLTMVMLFTSIVPASASGRPVNYLSEIHLAEAKNAEDAKQLLEENGFTVIDKNLNPDGDKAVYLGYKTSKNVEDAITDISVMNMDGGFSITDYEATLEESIAEYKDVIDEYRLIANEFAANYKAGKREAVLAYRQLNYYYNEVPVLDEEGNNVLDEEGNKKTTITYMGDYMLAFPSDDQSFVDILLKGNTRILANIRSLLAMGCGSSETTIDQRAAAAAADKAVYEKIQYHDYAKTFIDSLIVINKNIALAESEKLEIENSTIYTDEEKEELLNGLRLGITSSIAVKEILSKIPYGETNYAEYLDSVELSTIDPSVVYPIIEAMTEGQRKLLTLGQLTSVFLYDVVESDDEEIEAQLAEIEKDYEPLSVYLGTDMEIFEGACAVTSDALRNEAATGDSWSYAMGIAGEVVGATVMGVAGVFLITLAAKYLSSAFSYSTKFAELCTAQTDVATSILKWQGLVEEFSKMVPSNKVVNGINHCQKLIDSGHVELTQISSQKANLVQGYSGGYFLSGVCIVTGILFLSYGVYNVINLINRLNPSYTEIPLNIVDCRETDNGDRYIRYNVVNAYYKDGDTVKTKAGDTNGYDGDQWVSLYYTKNYEAGKCMTATADLPVSDSDFGAYSPVHKFGAQICYDLNSYNDNDSSEKIFLAFSNSNNKKAAETSVPSVVGSTVSYGLIGVSGVAGIGLGMLIMGVINRKKAKKES